MKLLVLDGNSIVNRAFYGIRMLTTKDGRFTNGIYGFLNILLRLMADQQPDRVAVAFDMRAPTFRHKMYGGYKANRKGMPPELAQQMPELKEILTLMGIKIVECEGYEADDIIGTLSAAAAANGDDCVIATGDRDSLQLVGDRVRVLLAVTKMGHPDITVYDRDKIREVYGLEPKQMIELKALMGDSSDCIPGVSGVGEKTALALVSRFGSLENLYDNLDDSAIKPGVRAKLEKDRDMAFLSRDLGTINLQAPVSVNPEEYAVSGGDDTALAAKLAGLELFKLIERLGLSEVKLPAAEAASEVLTALPADPSELVGDTVDLLRQENCVTLSQGLKTAEFSDLESALNAAKGKKIRTSDSKELRKSGGKNINIVFDSTLAAYLLNPSASGYDVDRLIQEYGVTVPQSENAGIAKGAAFTLLCDRLSRQIDENGQRSLLEDIEIPLAGVLADMEDEGFLVDVDGIAEFGHQLGERAETLTREIYELVGYEFNLNSPKQLGEALFEKLGLPAGKKTKSGYSTGAEVLENLRDKHPAVDKLLQYRTLSKLKSTYCDGLCAAVAGDGRIHSTLNQTETRTGRISSVEPNLQNIPVRSDIGRNMRKFFTARDGYLLCDADYSQIELRVLAHISGDRAMTEAFKNDVDIHAMTASQVFHIPLDEVTPLMRSRAKAVNFGIVYGIGAFSLAKDIGVSFGEAKEYINGYMATYEGVRRYMSDVVGQAKRQGYVETMFGRRRYLPELTASNANLRAFGERVARNAPIQGTAADIIKIAMIRVSERLKSEGLDAKLILQIHDELIVEASERDAERAAEVLRAEMEQACKMNVPLPADVHIGKTWYDAKG